MWTYRQSTGEMIRQDGHVAGVGYAGIGGAKNNGFLQDIHNVGPLPRGQYAMASPINTKTHGPFVIWLIPDPQNQMFGRAGFGIHSDSVVHPGQASEGCIVIAQSVRQAMWDSGDHALEVVA